MTRRPLVGAISLNIVEGGFNGIIFPPFSVGSRTESPGPYWQSLGLRWEGLTPFFALIKRRTRGQRGNWRRILSAISTSPLTTLKKFCNFASENFQVPGGPNQKVDLSCWNIQQCNIYDFQFWRKEIFHNKSVHGQPLTFGPLFRKKWIWERENLCERP